MMWDASVNAIWARAHGTGFTASMHLHDGTEIGRSPSSVSDELDRTSGPATLGAVVHPVGTMPHGRRVAMLRWMRSRLGTALVENSTLLDGQKLGVHGRNCCHTRGCGGRALRSSRSETTNRRCFAAPTGRRGGYQRERVMSFIRQHEEKQ